ncbi:MAG: response regulator transcription factor [Burkholderiaceae bacterium]
MKILIVDDHPLVRDAMARIVVELASPLDVLQAADCAAGLALAQGAGDLDLLLLDLNLPGVRGFEALEQFRHAYPALPVVVVSMYHDGDTVREVIRRGAMGFIPKVCSKEVILGALRLVLSGAVYVPSQAMSDNGGATATHSPGRAAQSVTELGLTARQGEVLALMMRGCSNKLICRDLGLAERTVKLHVTAILNTLRVTSRTQAVIVAASMGLDAENFS